MTPNYSPLFVARPKRSSLLAIGLSLLLIGASGVLLLF